MPTGDMMNAFEEGERYRNKQKKLPLSVDLPGEEKDHVRRKSTEKPQ